jgi:hypothetical protein
VYNINYYAVRNIHILTDLINALLGNSSVKAVQHTTIDEVVFSMSSAQSRCGKTGSRNPFLSNGSVNIFPRMGPCYESGDVINNRGSVSVESVQSACKRRE